MKVPKSRELFNRYAAMLAREQQRWEALEGIENWAYRFEQVADQQPDALVVQEVGQATGWSYRDLDRAGDQIAAWAAQTGAARIGVHQANGAVFLATVLGLAKAGIPAVLFNTREPASRLALLAERTELDLVIGSPINGTTAQDPLALLARPWTQRIRPPRGQAVTRDDPAVIIFTSGTSGPGKPALFSHRRLLGAGIAWSLRNGFDATTRCYIPLPLYHGNGLAVAFAACVEVGGCAVTRERFSVRGFWQDIRRQQCTACVYIGELWNYLLDVPAQPNDAENPLRVIFGNGLTTDLWPRVLRRFGIERVVEHFGATEMPAAALTNWVGQPGACGFIPPDHPNAAEVILVDDQGQALPFVGEGEAWLRVPGGRYRGYLDPSLDAAKLARGVEKSGDLWWKSGDRLRRDAAGFFYFVERCGDNFRWKGENISAAEVEIAIRAHEAVREVVVFGVPIPGMSGKIGMASLMPQSAWGEAQSDQLLAILRARLSVHAIPLVLRVTPQRHDTTATLKIPKARLAAEVFDPPTGYDHYILVHGRYAPLAWETFAALGAGHAPPGFGRIA